MPGEVLHHRPGGADIRSSGDNASLLPADAQAINDVANVESVVPERDGRATLRFGNTDYASQIQGVSADFPAVRDWPVASGVFFTDRDTDAYAPVIVLGKTVADTLFKNGEDPVGQYVLVSMALNSLGVERDEGVPGWPA